MEANQSGNELKNSEKTNLQRTKLKLTNADKTERSEIEEEPEPIRKPKRSKLKKMISKPDKSWKPQH